MPASRSYITRAHKMAIMQRAREDHRAALAHWKFHVEGKVGRGPEKFFLVQRGILIGMANVLFLIKQKELREKVIALLDTLPEITLEAP